MSRAPDNIRSDGEHDVALPAQRLKIAVVGCGALGGFYAAKLCRAGQDVWCLLRSDYEVVCRDGLEVRSTEGDFRVRPGVARSPHAIGPCDVVLVGLKTTANAVFPDLLPPLVGPGTAVVTLQNGLGNEEALAALFGVERVMGGLCFVCLNRIAPGVIVHMAHGRIVLGEFGRPAGARARMLTEAFRGAGVPCEVTDNLERAHWEKLVWNIPFNGLGVAGALGFDGFLQGPGSCVIAGGSCLSTQDLLGNPLWENVVRELMHEVIATARAAGLDVDPGWAEVQISRTRRMGAYRASTLIDFERGLPLELESLFCLPWRRAKELGVATPWWDRLITALRHLDPGAAGRA